MNLIVRMNIDNQMRQIPNIASFLFYDERSIPVILGIEYNIPEGIVRTFSDVKQKDFYDVLSRSGIAGTAIPGIVFGTPCLMCYPFLGKGCPEWVNGIFGFVAANDYGKHLFAAYRNKAGTFISSIFGEPVFEKIVTSIF